MRHTLPLMLLLFPASLSAQLANNSTRALGLAGAYVTSARGFESPAWNPATLARRGRPGFTLGLPQGQFEFGSSDFGVSDLRKWGDKFLSTQDKLEILAQIDTALGIRSNFGVSPIGLSIGNIAITLGTSGGVEGALGKDAVELALFGNASRSGPGQFFTAAGSRGGGWAATTAAVSYAMPLMSSPLGRLSVGATGKIIWGHLMGRAAELSSQFQVNPAFSANISGQALFTRYPSNTNEFSLGEAPGTGFGLDVGGLLEMPGGIVLGASLSNVINTMKWKSDRLEYRRVAYGVTQAAGGGTVTDTELDSVLVGAAIDLDPAARAFRDSVLDNSGFARVLRVGASKRMGRLTLAADGALRLSDGLDHPASKSVAAGVEYVLLGLIPLRGGIGTDFDSFTFSGGTGLYLGPVHIEFSAANITGDANPGVRVGAGLSLMF